ncbi:hypothetical protein CEXT_583481 [Caerostris extrusa]|uniref:Uncharacterized protein n=1 Tax=Caerostris extrusa TaxID=172846 RepID=A0AAV4RCZ9_CAEEX|nr:hypothetical protein CEXT_583481 [Caerostris extrusa]
MSSLTFSTARTRRSCVGSKGLKRRLTFGEDDLMPYDNHHSFSYRKQSCQFFHTIGGLQRNVYLEVKSNVHWLAGEIMGITG